VDVRGGFQVLERSTMEALGGKDKGRDSFVTFFSSNSDCLGDYKNTSESILLAQ